MKTFTNTHTLLYHTNDSISIPLRYSIIEGTTWFIGKDVAAICGYKDTWRAIKYHVSPENTDHTIFNSRKLIIINYAGFKEIRSYRRTSKLVYKSSPRSIRVNRHPNSVRSSTIW